MSRIFSFLLAACMVAFSAFGQTPFKGVTVNTNTGIFGAGALGSGVKLTLNNGVVSNSTAVNLTGSATNLILRNTLAPVTAYGATGDNSTDDAADIQEALDSGNPVFIPAGTYRVASKISVPSNARIYGSGDSSVIRAGSSSISAFEIAGKTNILIQGVSFLGASNNSAASSATGNAIYITNSSGIRIADTKIRYFNTGVYVTGNSRTVRVDGQSEFVGNARAALNTDTASDVVIYGARISGDRTSVGNGSRGMVGVWFQAGGWDNIADKCNIYYLSAEGVNIKATRSWAFGCHIEDADNGVIFETDGGDVISSENGSYGGAIGNTATNIAGIGVYAGNTIGVNNAVVHHVTIIGNVISGAEYGMSFAGLNSSATNERPYALTIKGNVVNGTTVGGGLLINANDSVFEGNIIRGAYTDGIQLYRGTNVAIIGNVISGPRNNGIYAFTGGLNNAIRGNSIFGGSASAADTYDGLRIASQTNAMIAGNIVSGSDWRYLASDESSSVGTMWVDNDLIGSAGTAVFNFAGSTSTRFNNYGGVINVNDANSRVGILTSSPGTTMSGQSATLDFRGRYMLLGSDLSADGSRTDDTSKRFAYLFSPYDTTPAVQVIGLLFDSGSANHVLNYGGGSSAGYAATRHAWWAGANTATTTGTEVMRLTTTGVSIGYASDPGVALDVNGSIRIAYGSNYQSKDSGGSTKTLMTYSDSSGVILGNGSDPIQLQPGTSGVNLTAVGTTSPVTMKRLASATSGATLKDSAQLKFETSYWDGANNVEVSSRIVGVMDSTTPLYSLVFKDNAGSNTMAITNNGNVTVAGQFKASGGITNTTVSGNTISSGSGTLALGSSTLTLSQSATLNGSASGQVLQYDGTSWAAATPAASGIGGSTGSTDNSLLRADGTGGATIQNSAVIIDDYTSSTANNVAIKVDDGSTANISAVITPKGTGAFILGPKPDGTTTGGVARGQYAVDLQLSHAAWANAVASGNYSLAGVYYALASGTYSVALGYASTASGGNAGVIAGHAGTASGNYSFVGGGYGSTASGAQSAFLAGQGSATATYAVGTGEAVSNKRGMFAISGGSFATAGDAQTFLITARNSTSSTTPTVLFLNGSSERITIPSNATWTFTALLTGTTASGAATYSYKFDGVIVNAAGTTSMPVAVTKTVIYESNAAADADATANNTSDALDFTVTAPDSTAVRWSVSVTANQVSY